MANITVRTERFVDPELLMAVEQAYGNMRVLSDLIGKKQANVRRVLLGQLCTEEEKEEIPRLIRQWLPDAIEERARGGDTASKRIIGALLYALMKKDREGGLLYQPPSVK